MKAVEMVAFGNRMTPSQIALQLNQEVDDLEVLVVVGLDKKGDIRVGRSSAKTTTHMGMLRYAEIIMGVDAYDDPVGEPEPDKEEK